jgi:hypothetical protein
VENMEMLLTGNQILIVYYSLLSSLTHTSCERTKRLQMMASTRDRYFNEIQQRVIGCRRIHNVAY